jgi:hypothetical protein
VAHDHATRPAHLIGATASLHSKMSFILKSIRFPPLSIQIFFPPNHILFQINLLANNFNEFLLKSNFIALKVP